MGKNCNQQLNLKATQVSDVSVKLHPAIKLNTSQSRKPCLVFQLNHIQQLNLIPHPLYKLIKFKLSTHKIHKVTVLLSQHS